MYLINTINKTYKLTIAYFYIKNIFIIMQYYQILKVIKSKLFKI